jgi:hypothetical protein
MPCLRQIELWGNGSNAITFDGHIKAPVALVGWIDKMTAMDDGIVHALGS